jgi:hypothetical protein
MGNNNILNRGCVTDRTNIENNFNRIKYIVLINRYLNSRIKSLDREFIAELITNKN